MFAIKQVTIGDGERGLLYINRQLRRVLMPGVYRFFNPLARIEVRVEDISEPRYRVANVDVVIQRLGARLADYFILADIGEDEIGLLYRHGKLADVLAPGSRRLYWKGVGTLRVEKLPMPADRAVSEAMLRPLQRLRAAIYSIAVAEVPEQSVALMTIAGKLNRTLAPGVYGFWNFDRRVRVDVVDLRNQAIDVSGQELLTRDKVSLRANLSATYRITDPVAARNRVAKLNDTLYRELQFGLRKAVAAKTLDELLGDKATLDGDIFAHVRGRVAEFGVEMLGAGVKDLILPGEMKTILNGVVEAEKAAQADVIRRRQEANAARSLANTATLMASNPTLLRLKELEALERVTAKVEKLTVYSGLEGMLGDLVKLRHNA
jgi:regulator of protease activity HflC (stomatin/prohibitin superfamily)